MTRTPEDFLGAMASTARLAPIADGVTWRDALFTSGPHGRKLSAPAEPDRQLLAALADEYSLADLHVDELRARLHISWLESILGIPRLPVMPDRVVASATVEPTLAPAVVPAGTMLRGGKDAYGTERRYRTLDALTAHGAALVGVRGTVPGGPAGGNPGLRLEAPEFPIAPPANEAESLIGAPAVHVLRITSPVLAFTEGDMKIRLSFSGSAGVAALRTAGRWRHRTTDGSLSPEVQGTGTGADIVVMLHDGCVDPDGGAPWIECIIPADQPVPESLHFGGVTVAVTERTEVLADAAFANDGAVDVTKEFDPFAPTARKGDAFYIRSDEALAKPLASLTVHLGVYAAATGGLTGGGYSTRAYFVMGDGGGGWAEDHPVVDLGEASFDLAAPGYRPPLKIQWQHKTPGGWGVLAEQSALATMTTVSGASPASAPFTVAGQEGRYVRAIITSGDLGWREYLDTVAFFATKAVKNPASAPSMPTPPVPARYSSLWIDYTTTHEPVARVESWSGWRHQVMGSGPFTPFRRAVDATGTPGMIAIGQTLPAAVAGSTVSLYVVLDSASPCGSSEDPTAHWEWWDGGAWQPLPIADGTHRMREAGLLRFVAPDGWADGCEDLTADAGKWIRFVTAEPQRIGVIHDVIPDAVIAEYVSQAPEPAADPTPATALDPGAIKGVVTPVPGVKKVTNLASVRGRGPESDANYARRASSLVRHRGRAITAWDYEQLVAEQFPEVAAVRCLPHTGAAGAHLPGSVGLVVIPDQRDKAQPRPSVSLAGRIGDALNPAMPMGAAAAILCPLYVEVSVTAAVRLRRGVAALTGKTAVTQALETLLHPTGTSPTRWGVSLYSSTLIAALERIPVVDVVTSFSMSGGAGGPVEVIDVDACRGLYCSAGDHVLSCEEQL